MKLRNKITGEIVDVRMSYREDTAPIVVSETTCDENGQSQGWPYNSLAELNEEWEDAPEEPKEYWYIDCYGEVLHAFYNGNEWDEQRKLIGNYFETKKEAEKVIEKLKAWKRLKDKGFRFKGLDRFGNIRFEVDDEYKFLHLNLYPFRKFEKDEIEFLEDLELLFGGEK